jgi:thiol-disulfide isomerase/thioredoxin
MSLDKILERSANGFLILTCLALCYRFLPAFSTGHPPSSAGVVRRAEPDLRGVSLDDIRPRRDAGGVLLFLSSSCPYCERSLPFYRSLAQPLKDAGKSMLVTLVDKDSTVSGGEEFIRSKGIPDAVPVALPPLARFPIKATPTLVAYDAQGGVVGTWTGLLAPARQTQVRSTLAGHRN